MSKKFIFWLLMFLWLIFGIIVPNWGAAPKMFAWNVGGSLLEFILFGLLGWQVFGKPIE